MDGGQAEPKKNLTTWSEPPYPTSIIRHPSSIVHRPSSIVHCPLSIINHPSSIISFDIFCSGWYWLFLFDHGCSWLLLVDLGWSWLISVDLGWSWLILVDLGWSWLIFDDIGWSWLSCVKYQVSGVLRRCLEKVSDGKVSDGLWKVWDGLLFNFD